MARSHSRGRHQRHAAAGVPDQGGGRTWIRWLLVGAAGLGLALLFQAYRRHEQPRNLLLVTIDTLRADHVGAYGYGKGTTPVLDGLVARGTRFESAQSAVPLTGPSHATLLTGAYPPVHGVRDNVRFGINTGVATLAERLRRAGYETGAFIGAFPVAAAFGFGRGFETFDEGLHPSAELGGVAERPANEVADAAIAWLSAPHKRPFLAWVHFFDPHQPYNPPPPYRDRFASPYDGEVAFADSQLGRLLEALRSVGHEENTIVVVLSDHGEGLGDHGESAHGLLLYESTLHVPLVFAGPGVPAGRVVAARVGTIDVLPTVMALVGHPAVDALAGRDLSAAMRGGALRSEPLYAESLYGRLNCRWAALRAWTDRDWKLVEGNGAALFDLTGDPGELQDRAGSDSERQGELSRALHRAVNAMAPGGDRARPRPIGADEAEALRSLGYAAGGGGAGEVDEPGLVDPRQRLPLFERLHVLSGAATQRVPSAMEEVAQLAREDPGNPFVQEVLAGLALRIGRRDLAASALAAFLEIEPDRADVRARRGSLLRSLGRWDEAEGELRRALADGGADAFTRAALADALVAQGSSAKLQEAEQLLEGVLASDPRHHSGNLALGRLRLAQGRPAEAASRFEAAAAGGDREALLELAEVYAGQGRTAASEEAARRVLAGEPANPWALALVGHARILQGDAQQGQALLERAMRVGPRRPQVWLRLAAGFQALGRGDIARQCRAAASGTRTTGLVRANGGRPH